MGANCGAAPGQDIHGAGGEGHNGGQRSAAHAERVIQRKQRGHTDQEGDRSGAVQMDDGSQNGGADADFDGIGAYQVQNALDDGAEGAGIGQDAKEQNGEDEHDAGGRHGADALGAGDHVAQGLEVGEKVHNTLRSLRGALRHDRDEEAGDDAGDHGNYDQSHQRRCFLVIISTSMMMTVRNPRIAKGDIHITSSYFKQPLHTLLVLKEICKRHAKIGRCG